ncbi:hypothetical protein [Ruegeria sp. HKCCSA071]|nr:hypothetical protein [Ruegeria sp. HKCCSA071]
MIVPEGCATAILRLPDPPASPENTLYFANLEEVFQRETAQF